MFTKFQAEQPNLKNIPVFLKGDEFYCDMTKPFLEELDKEIERTKNTIEELHQVKEAKIKELLELFDIEILVGSSSLEDASETLRKLPRFGYIKGSDPKFEWPTTEDLLKMPKDKPIRVVGFGFKK